MGNYWYYVLVLVLFVHSATAEHGYYATDVLLGFPFLHAFRNWWSGKKATTREPRQLVQEFCDDRTVKSYHALIENSIAVASALSLAAPPGGGAGACDFSNNKTTAPACLHAILDHPEVTVGGCTCRTHCDASITESLYRCDWCYTENNCGLAGIWGRWDFCDHSQVVPYEKQSWQHKLETIWYGVEQTEESGARQSPLASFTESLKTTFERVGDVFPYKKPKSIHSNGVVCRVSLDVSEDSPFTGILSPGQRVHGVVRLGNGIDEELAGGVTPGAAFKFFRTGKPSANIMVSSGLAAEPNGNYDFFVRNMSNHLKFVSTVPIRGLRVKSVQASACFTRLGLSDACTYDQEGHASQEAPVFPYKLTLSSNLSTAESACSTADLLSRIRRTVITNTLLFAVTAWQSPDVETHIATITTESKCVTSKFGDDMLFFKHQGIEHDWQLRPDFFDDSAMQDCDISVSTGMSPPPVPGMCIDQDS